MTKYRKTKHTRLIKGRPVSPVSPDRESGRSAQRRSHTRRLACPCGATQSFEGVNAEAVALCIERSGWQEGTCPACQEQKRRKEMERMKHANLEKDVLGIVQAKGPCRFGDVLSGMIRLSNSVYSSDVGEAVCAALGDGRLQVAAGGILSIPSTDDTPTVPSAPATAAGP